jgi:hypothetical protein
MTIDSLLDFQDLKGKQIVSKNEDLTIRMNSVLLIDLVSDKHTLAFPLPVEKTIRGYS